MAVTVKTMRLYVTSDGKEWLDPKRAEQHEADIIPKTKYEKYLKTYNGKSLLSKYSLNEKGVWDVHGEDPNPDFGGQHHNPRIGIFSGKLDDVIRNVVMEKGFWSWGAGGTIERCLSITLYK